jgi:hypothetical protein
MSATPNRDRLQRRIRSDVVPDSDIDDAFAGLVNTLQPAALTRTPQSAGTPSLRVGVDAKAFLTEVRR